MEETGNARVVPATELVGPTCGIVATVWGFVGSVGAVHATVAHPRLNDAMAPVVALELVRSALRLSGDFLATLSIIIKIMIKIMIGWLPWLPSCCEYPPFYGQVRLG